MPENELTRQLMQRFEQLAGGFDELVSGRFGTRIQTKVSVLRNWREVERIVRELARMTDISMTEHFPDFPEFEASGMARTALTEANEAEGMRRRGGRIARLLDARSDCRVDE